MWASRGDDGIEAEDFNRGGEEKPSDGDVDGKRFAGVEGGHAAAMAQKGQSAQGFGTLM